MRTSPVSRYAIPFLVLLILLLFFGNLLFGAVPIPADEVCRILLGGEADKSTWATIVVGSRIPQAATALLAGAALAVSGLVLQTAFNNPLAGPSILGIDSGASLGVAVVMLFLGGSIGGLTSNFSLSGHLAVVAAAFAGAGCILAIIIFFSTIIKSNTMLLITGIMVGYVTSSAISLLNFFATAEGVFGYTIWGMGNFSGVSLEQLPFFSVVVLFGLFIALLLIKPLNALLLGDMYAANLGVRIRRTRLLLLISTGLLTAVSTAYCGPIAFIGLAVPHLARLLLRSSNHNILLPVTMLLGSAFALFCNLVSVLPGSLGVIPLNAITPVLGAPVIIYVIVNQKRIQYFH